MLTDVEMLQGEITLKEVIDNIFNSLEKKLLDRKEITLDFEHITFISVYFLERLERFVGRAKDLNVKVQIKNVQSNIYKVFQVAKVKDILNYCN